MSSTYSSSYTYTTSDIAKVFDQVRADFHMAAQSTRLWTEASVDRLCDDIKRYAQKAYITKVAIYLVDASEAVVRAATYEISESASAWQANRPGNMLWPLGAGVRLRVTVDMSEKWWKLSQSQRDEFKKTLHLEWPSTSTQDLGFPNLSKAADRTYVSNGYGVQKTSFK